VETSGSRDTVSLSARVAAVVVGCVLAAGAEQMILTVHAGPRQTFGGFGVSLTNDSRYGSLSEARKDELARAVFGDLRLKILKLWCGPADGWAGTFYNTGLISKATDNGLTMLLQAPCGTESPASVADKIVRFRDLTGLTFSATGISNECNMPSNHDFSVPPGPPYYTPEQAAEVVKQLRVELDDRGLTDVKIVAPETVEGPAEQRQPNFHDDDIRYFDALKADDDAWAALDGFATHTYGQGAKKEIADRLIGTGKEYWMTEHSINGYEDPLNEPRAALTGGSILGDLNNMVTHWIYFIGFAGGGFSDQDAGVKLVTYSDGGGNNWMRFHLKYYYMKQISQAFDVGCVFRFTESDTAAPCTNMEFAYQNEPDICAAAARNPDGGWAIALINLTGLETEWINTTECDWNQADAHAYEVTVHVEELAGNAEVPFRMTGSSKDAQLADRGTAVMRNGTLSLSINSLELVSLRCDSLGIVAVNGPGAAVGRQALPLLRMSGSTSGLRASLRTDRACTVEGFGPDGRRAFRFFQADPGDSTFELPRLAAGVYAVRLSSPGPAPARTILCHVR